MISGDDMPELPGAVSALYFGGISLISEPAADAYASLCAREAGTRVIMIDPNIRQGFISNEAAYRARVTGMIASSEYREGVGRGSRLAGAGRRGGRGQAGAAVRWRSVCRDHDAGFERRGGDLPATGSGLRSRHAGLRCATRLARAIRSMRAFWPGWRSLAVWTRRHCAGLRRRRSKRRWISERGWRR